jgi:hypothetical protein
MAMVKDIDSARFGFTLRGAYLRISRATFHRVRGDTPKFRVTVDVATYAATPANDDVAPVEVDRLHADLEDVQAMKGDDIIEKTYRWLMSRPEYAEAIEA